MKTQTMILLSALAAVAYGQEITAGCKEGKVVVDNRTGKPWEDVNITVNESWRQGGRRPRGAVSSSLRIPEYAFIDSGGRPTLDLSKEAPCKSIHVVATSAEVEIDAARKQGRADVAPPITQATFDKDGIHWISPGACSAQ